MVPYIAKGDGLEYSSRILLSYARIFGDRPLQVSAQYPGLSGTPKGSKERSLFGHHIGSLVTFPGKFPMFLSTYPDGGAVYYAAQVLRDSEIQQNTNICFVRELTNSSRCKLSD